MSSPSDLFLLSPRCTNGCEKMFHRYFCPNGEASPANSLSSPPELSPPYSPKYGPVEYAHSPEFGHSSHWEHLKTCASCFKPLEFDSNEKDEKEERVHDDWQGYEEARGVARDMASSGKKRGRAEHSFEEVERGEGVVEGGEKDMGVSLSWKDIKRKQQKVANMILDHYSTIQSPPIALEDFVRIWKGNIITAREKEESLKRELMNYLHLLESYLK